MTTKNTETYNITDASELCGFTPSVLRIWELRYHWPKPRRKSNGYRYFTKQDLEALQVVAHFIKLGRSIGEIIEDRRISPVHNPKITLETLYPRRVAPAPLDFSTIPWPETMRGKQIREQLEAAIIANQTGQIAQLEAESSRLPPAERERSVTALLTLVRNRQALKNTSATSSN